MSEEEKKQQNAEQSKQAQPQATKPVPKKSKKTLFIVLGVLAALFACGVIVVGAGIFIAGRAAKSGLESIEKKAKSLKYEDEETGSKTEAGEDVEKPDNWPKDIPIYEGTLKYSSTVKDKTFMVGVNTGDKASTVMGYYKKNMEAQGWKEQSKGNYGGTETASYSKETEKRTATISVTKDTMDKGKNYVTITTTSY